MSEKITAMIEEIKALSVLELKELVDGICETFGVSAVAAAAAPAAGAAEAAAEKTEFDVVMTEFGAEKIKVIKEVRGITAVMRARPTYLFQPKANFSLPIRPNASMSAAIKSCEMSIMDMARVVPRLLMPSMTVRVMTSPKTPPSQYSLLTCPSAEKLPCR